MVGPTVLRELLAISKFSKYDRYFARFLGWYEDEHFGYLAMEYLQHGTLYDAIHKKEIRLRESEAKMIIQQLLEGLIIMHNHDYAHRDLKLENIFVASPGPKWRIKIGDFGTYVYLTVLEHPKLTLWELSGISKRISDGSVLCTMDRCTPEYAAPEMTEIVGKVASSKGYQYTKAVDIWAVGVIAFELLDEDGARPVKYTDLKDYYNGRMKFPRKRLERKVHPDGIDLLAQMLKPFAKDRPSAAEALDNSWFCREEFQPPRTLWCTYCDLPIRDEELPNSFTTHDGELPCILNLVGD
ncbi:Calcium calmodulin-dependent protein kinase type 1b [Lasiodiplodia theobromae]|uniref:Calcium calmodulin-dependent protein kinase type 1b n=1 Tax=Lasiodiplodia theobromae TaxID=45133 RepID=UPI0015C3F600|nr:Calcium calmodulin-dependent protein kinase type 1b [Lasiodiplodia theobromae]KAF4544540.1 Calcium calmodulin-dependent protein kinase type 1b [Lasiodiplodia theobromae]